MNLPHLTLAALTATSVAFAVIFALALALGWGL